MIHVVSSLRFPSIDKTNSMEGIDILSKIILQPVSKNKFFIHNLAISFGNKRNFLNLNPIIFTAHLFYVRRFIYVFSVIGYYHSRNQIYFYHFPNICFDMLCIIVIFHNTAATNTVHISQHPSIYSL